MGACDAFEKWSQDEREKNVPDKINVTDNRFKLLINSRDMECAWMTDPNKFHWSRFGK